MKAVIGFPLTVGGAIFSFIVIDDGMALSDAVGGGIGAALVAFAFICFLLSLD